MNISVFCTTGGMIGYRKSETVSLKGNWGEGRSRLSVLLCVCRDVKRNFLRFTRWSKNTPLVTRGPIGTNENGGPMWAAAWPIAWFLGVS